MKIMWLDTPVDVMVEFRAGVSFPRLQTLHVGGVDVTFAAPARIDATSSGLLYRLICPQGSYTLRFEREAQRWILESVSGMSLASISGLSRGLSAKQALLRPSLDAALRTQAPSPS
ncbi:MAG: hypothetical protein AB1778_10145 [Candidatus Bipolaricaulota bacterium]